MSYKYKNTSNKEQNIGYFTGLELYRVQIYMSILQIPVNIFMFFQQFFQTSTQYISLKFCQQISQPMLHKFMLILLVLLYTVTPLCADPDQPQNSCTACVANDILIDGTCYVKIRGCLKDATGPVCIQCQFGYVLVNGTCIRQAVFFNNSNLTTIPPVVITPPQTLTYQQIQTKIGSQNTPNFQISHQYFVNRYASQLGRGNIKQIQSLQTKTGFFIIILYQGDTKIQYEAVAYFDINNLFKQWNFNVLGQYRKNIWIAQNYSKNILGDKIINYLLYQISQNIDIITIDYINNNNNIVRAVVNRNDLASQQILASKLQILSLTISDIGVQKIKILYPELDGFRVTSIEKIDQYYVVNFGLGMSVSFKYSNFRFTINLPLKVSSSTYLSSDSLFNNIFLNSFSIFFNYLDPQFMASRQYITKQFPQTNGAAITKVQTQNPNSITYRINMKKFSNLFQVDQYQFLVWFNSSNLAYLIQGKKNNKIIYQDYYNYNADSTFLSNYFIIQNKTKIVNLLPISSVLYKFTNNSKYYKIIYNANQFAEFQYLTDSKKDNFISYYIDGQNIVDILAGRTIPRKTPQQLLKYIKQQQNIITLGLIKQIVYTIPTYLVTIVTNTGTYKTQIQDKSGQLAMIQFFKIDSLTCFQMNLNLQQLNKQKIKDIDDLVRRNYPIEEYQLQLVQVSISWFSYSYRVVYVNTKLKQLVIMLQQYNKFINIIKVQTANDGYQTLQPSPNNTQYKTISSLITSSNMVGNKIPFLTQTNNSMIRAYYNDGKSTYQIYYDKNKNKQYSQVIATRSYLLVPDGFSLSNLLIPGTPSQAENTTLNRIVRSVMTRYGILLNGATLVFADRINNTYNLMFKNIFGYCRLQALNNNGNINIGRLVVTAYKDSDFSNCKRFDITGKCLSCDTTQLEYQGYCYKGIQGCEVQPGSICIKCNVNYIKMNQKCYRQCNNFFK